MNNQENKNIPLSFLEVNCGFTKDEARIEASRCLSCKHEPCRTGCPVNVPIKQFIKELKENQVDEAYQTITSENKFPSICGRVCPQEKQCELNCVLNKKNNPIKIGMLERFVGDYARKPKIKIDLVQDYKIAVIGSGPAGMACAIDLAKMGYKVTMFEALHELGGVLTYGIPNFRLPKDIVKKELSQLKELNIEIQKNVIIGKTITLKQLFQCGFHSVFIGTGAGLPKSLNIKGENYDGVFYANGFLTRVNLLNSGNFPKYHTPFKLGNQVAVIGAGNVAMDAARCAKRLGAKEVYVIYRRSIEEAPARKEELEHALEEGILFKFLCNPVEILGSNYCVSQIKCEIMKLVDSGIGRKNVEGTNEFIFFDVDSIIVAIGQNSNPTIFSSNEGIKTNKYQNILVNENLETNLENVYAGGDIVSGAATVILAMQAGRKAAKSIDEKIKNMQK